MDVIECLAVLHEENMAMVKRLLRPVDSDGDEMLEIILTWPKEPGEILTPLSTPTEYNLNAEYVEMAHNRIQGDMPLFNSEE